MRNCSHIFIGNRYHGWKKEVAKVSTQIHSKRESPDSPGSFGFKRTRATNFGTLQKIKTRHQYANDTRMTLINLFVNSGAICD